jgi:hypothetical protein
MVLSHTDGKLIDYCNGELCQKPPQKKKCVLSCYRGFQSPRSAPDRRPYISAPRVPYGSLANRNRGNTKEPIEDGSHVERGVSWFFAEGCCD